MTTVLLIPCVGLKLAHRAPARDLYQGPLFSACLAYSESIQPDATYILSAMHGLVSLDQELDPYDVTLRELPEPERSMYPFVRVLTDTELDQWAQSVIAALESLYKLDSTIFIALADSSYILPLRSALPNLREPLAGMSLADRPAAIAAMIARG
jgi:hypothetical protein